MKLVWSVLSLAAFVAIVGALLFFFKFNYILGRMLSAKFGTLVKIEKVLFKRQEVNIQKFTLNNPPNYSVPLALDIDIVDVNAPYLNYFKKEIQIQEIEIHNATLNIVFKNKLSPENNWSTLVGSLATDNASEKKKKEEEKNGQYAIIHHLKINHLTVNIITPGRKTETKVFNDMVFNDVVTTKGDITRRVAQVVVYYLIFNYQNIIQLPAQSTQGFFDIFKGIQKPALGNEG